MKLPKFLTTVTPLSKALALSLYIVVLALGFWLGSSYEASKVPEPKSGDIISRQQAKDLIRQCKANGVYTTHNGETGLILKGDVSYRVEEGVSVEFLLSSQNPICPFSKAAIE